MDQTGADRLWKFKIPARNPTFFSTAVEQNLCASRSRCWIDGVCERLQGDCVFLFCDVAIVTFAILLATEV